MKKVKLADVLWDAANKHLSPDSGYSCFAVWDAIGDWMDTDEVHDFLMELGCRTGTVMNEFPVGPLRQGVRYMWLLLAMHVAEDENIEIEVNQC